MVAPNQIPFPVQPNFRMQPGLRRHDGALTCRDADFADTQHCVQRAAQQGWLPVGLWQVPQLASAIDEASALLLTAPGTASGAPTGRSSQGGESAADRLLGLRRQVQEDLVLLAPGDAGQVVAMAVALPSGWNPVDKAGLSFAQIHAVVPEAGTIRRSASQLMRLPQSGGVYRRFVWDVGW